ncbi:MAG: hypothetical protein R3D71_10045 [Rickettsiales bacterium]
MLLTETKLLLKTVADLRAKGELDEEKWGRISKYILSFYGGVFIIASSFILYDYFYTNLLIKLPLFAIIMAFVFFLTFMIINKIFVKKVVNFILLYTIGKKAMASLIRCDWTEGMYFVKRYSLDYSYKNNIGKIYIKKNENCSDLGFLGANINILTSLKAGDNINILYLEKYPITSTIFVEELNEKYNLRRGTNHATL